MSRVTGVCAVKSPLCEWPLQTVLVLVAFSSFLYDNDNNNNNHRSTHRGANTLQSSYHLRSGSLLTTLASRQPHSDACTAAVVPVHD